jgi:hypothetical protein
VVRSLSSTSSSEVLPAPPTVEPWLQDPSDLKVQAVRTHVVPQHSLLSLGSALHRHIHTTPRRTRRLRPSLKWDSYSMFPFSCGFCSIPMA